MSGQKHLPGKDSHKTPLADHLAETLRDPLRAHLPTDTEYLRALDRFEALPALVYADVIGADSNWAPLGRFFWREREVFDTIAEEVTTGEGVWEPLRAGLFRGDPERLSTALEKMRTFFRGVPTWR